MARLLDSSVLIRYLTDDDPPRARVAEAIIASDELLVTGVVLAEAAYTLRSAYRYPRGAIVDALLAFIQLENIDVLDAEKAHVAIALDKARSGGLSFGDALILAQMRSAGVRDIYSFDKDFRDPSIEVLDRPAAP